MFLKARIRRRYRQLLKEQDKIFAGKGDWTMENEDTLGRFADDVARMVGEL